jgi:hypothetical protein
VRSRGAKLSTIHLSPAKKPGFISASFVFGRREGRRYEIYLQIYPEKSDDSSFLLFDSLENEARKEDSCIQTLFAFVLNDNPHKIAILDKFNPVMKQPSFIHSRLISQVL